MQNHTPDRRPSALLDLCGKLYKTLKPYNKSVRGSHGQGWARVLEKNEMVVLLDAYMEDFGVDYLTIISVYNVRTMKIEEMTLSNVLNEKEEFLFFFKEAEISDD